MSENLPQHESWTIASLAHDIVLHYGEHHEDTEGNSFARAEWNVEDPENEQIWEVALGSDGHYSSTRYWLEIKGMTESALHCYVYNVTKGVVTYEPPQGAEQATYTHAQIVTNFHAWLRTHPTPEAITYDEAGEETRRQYVFNAIAGRIAIDEILETTEGKHIFDRLVTAQSAEEAERLYQDFYGLSLRPEASFHIGPGVTQSVLERLVAAYRSQQKMPTRQPHTDR